MDKNIESFLTEFRELSKHTHIKKEGTLSDELLPSELWYKSRQNIEKVCSQINTSYYYGIYDGALVLSRKLIEMLLILSFKNYKQEYLIKDGDNNYRQLSEIIAIAKDNRVIDFTRSAKENLEVFREKGNLSAHNPFYNALKKDLDGSQSKLRQLVEELFYKSGIRV